jgi:hypothetical protein
MWLTVWKHDERKLYRLASSFIFFITILTNQQIEVQLKHRSCCAMCQHFSQPITWRIMMTGNFTGLLLHAYSLTSQQIEVQLKHRSCCTMCQHFSQPITWRIMMTGNFTGLLLHLNSLSFVHGSADWGTTKTLVVLRHASTLKQAKNLMKSW